MQAKPTGTVLYRAGKSKDAASKKIYAIAKWRDSTRRQHYRRLGLAWVERDGDGEWKKRRGSAPDGYLTPRDAVRRLDELVEETEKTIGQPNTDHALTFAELVPGYLNYAEHTQHIKPSTLHEYRRLLADPEPRKRQQGEHVARIMREFSSRPASKITSADVERFLRALDREGLSPRNVNVHRQVLANVFRYAIGDADLALGLAENPVGSTAKRDERFSKFPETFTAEEVLAIARAAREGRHRTPREETLSDEEILERTLADEQDAALYIVAGFSGLRQGELRALRWKQVRFADRTLLVVAGMSAGVESSTKSGKWRAVPLTREAFVALDGLSRRDRFTADDDYVFCGPTGEPLNESALRRRYKRARDAAGAPPLPFHHLRHTFATLTIRILDPATVQTLMGHSKITTTERYLHARPLSELAERLDAAFAPSVSVRDSEPVS